MTGLCLEVTLVKRALDDALDIFGPLIKQAVFEVFEKKVPPLSDGNYNVEQIEGVLLETMGNPAGKILIKRFREEISFVENGR